MSSRPNKKILAERDYLRELEAGGFSLYGWNSETSATYMNPAHRMMCDLEYPAFALFAALLKRAAGDPEWAKRTAAAIEKRVGPVADALSPISEQGSPARSRQQWPGWSKPSSK